MYQLRTYAYVSKLCRAARDEPLLRFSGRNGRLDTSTMEIELPDGSQVLPTVVRNSSTLQLYEQTLWHALFWYARLWYKDPFCLLVALALLVLFVQQLLNPINIDVPPLSIHINSTSAVVLGWELAEPTSSAVTWSEGKLWQRLLIISGHVLVTHFVWLVVARRKSQYWRLIPTCPVHIRPQLKCNAFYHPVDTRSLVVRAYHWVRGCGRLERSNGEKRVMLRSADVYIMGVPAAPLDAEDSVRITHDLNLCADPANSQSLYDHDKRLEVDPGDPDSQLEPVRLEQQTALCLPSDLRRQQDGKRLIVLSFIGTRGSSDLALWISRLDVAALELQTVAQKARFRFVECRTHFSCLTVLFDWTAAQARTCCGCRTPRSFLTPAALGYVFVPFFSPDQVSEIAAKDGGNQNDKGKADKAD